jgi:hypothetical protein
MYVRYRTIVVALIVLAHSSSFVFATNNLTIGGRVTLNSTAKMLPNFTVKLFPPKQTRSPILLTTTNGSGDFKFAGLSNSSYLLEVYLGKALVHQQVVNAADPRSASLSIALKQ